jgi:pSer/pThr/pTyr-binding forkhead associated (FHA) protein
MPAELFLNFVDEKRAKRRVKLDVSPFSIGRTPENDLQISDAALSRRHAKIERFGDIFVLSDYGSSNGTRINGEEVTQPVAIQNGDTLMLGGAIEVAVEITGIEAVQYSTANVEASSNNSASSENAAWSSLFFIAPLCGVLVLVFVGVLFFVFGERRTEPVVIARQNQNIDDPSENNGKSNQENSNEDPEETPTPRNNSNKGNSGTNSSNPTNSSVNDSPPDPAAAELDKVERNAYQFLRSISHNDPSPVLIGKQVALINARIKSYKNSAALRTNLRSAKNSAASFQTISNAQGLKPSLLAAAALMKLNETSGNPETTANTIAPNLGKLGGILGTDLANDCLLVIAAMEEGGSENSMRDKLQNLSKSQNANVATVRTIWFLHENGKLSDASFNSVLRFIAIGTIAQNPKDFGVDAEPLSF